jgi:hypothetical protein
MHSVVKIHKPTPGNQHKINKSDKAVYRFACAAGVNRSATVRQIFIDNITSESIFYPQYGAHYGCENATKIKAFDVNKYDVPDAFSEVFGCSKTTNMQAQIFEKIGYQNMFIEDWHHTLDESHRTKYKELLDREFWTVHVTTGISMDSSKIKNVFVLINECDHVKDNVVEKLNKIGEPVELIWLKLDDYISTPRGDYLAQSKHAYIDFISQVDELIEFI